MTQQQQRPTYTQSERNDYVRAWKRSKMTCSAFARKADINEKSLWRWIKKIDDGSNSKRASTKTSVSASLLPVTDVQLQPAKKMATPPQPNIEIVLPSGIRLRFTSMNDATVLASFVRALEPCS